MKNFCKKYYKVVLAALFCIGVGIVGELLYNLPVEKRDDYQYLSSNQITTEGFVEDGEREGMYATTGVGGEIKLTFDKQFVDKLHYQYRSPGHVDTIISVEKETKSGKIKEIEISDKNNFVWEVSTVNIHQETGSITITFPESTGGGIYIMDIAINNTTNYSIFRVLFYSLAAALFLFVLAIFKGWIKWKPEMVFLVIASSIGALMLVTLPSHKIGFDEQIHFGRAFYLFETFAGKEDITIKPVIEELYSSTLANWHNNVPQSEEEHKIEKEYWNNKWRENIANPAGDIVDRGYSFQLYSLSYIPQATMIKLGQLLDFDLTIIYAMGRLGNLITYCLIVFFAIRHIVIGKRIMLILALMPTAIFSAATYSYDAFTTAFSFLGIAYLVTELVQSERKISYKNCAIFSLALMLASFPKPIYIPMIAVALFFPASKFRSRREKIIFKGIIGAIFALMMASFMLPPILEPNRPGDARGGDTNIGQQLRYIFAKPLLYTQLLIDNIGSTFYPYIFGKEGLGGMGHAIAPPTGILITSLLGYATLSDGIGTNGERIKRFYKFAIIGISFVVMCLIWTALYLSFTPVGEAAINGVHGRYYLPVTMLLLLAFNMKNFRFAIKERIDHTIITGASTLILLAAVYSAFVVNTF